MIRHLPAVLATTTVVCTTFAIYCATHDSPELAIWWAWIALFAAAGTVFAAVISTGSSDE